MDPEDYLARCAHLALLGTGDVLDNPRVGAVLVYDGRIIGEGYHKRAGEAHAEVNCLASIKPEDRTFIPESTLYVSLEPCCISGRTGACTDLIKKHGIRDVVFAQRDTTKGVNGESVAILMAEGIKVREYPDFRPTLVANAHRRTLTLEERPRIILKFAKSADGFIRPKDREEKYWITNSISRRLVHRWRAETSAILVGGRTVVDDDPSLTTRLFPGPQARPVVLDLRNRVTGKEQLFNGVGRKPLLFAGTKRTGINAEVVVIGPDLDKAALTQVLSTLKEQRLGQVTVEGGAATLQAFLSSGFWDEARVFTGQVRFGDGVPAPVFSLLKLVSQEDILGDLLSIYRPGLTQH
jgi:diaminohydroxyphosphoribosylaminopyrimidine deaminase/5-amino-6-(5-phosphoribosylamino)uracil reductase